MGRIRIRKGGGHLSDLNHDLKHRGVHLSRPGGDLILNTVPYTVPYTGPYMGWVHLSRPLRWDVHIQYGTVSDLMVRVRVRA